MLSHKVHKGHKAHVFFVANNHNMTGLSTMVITEQLDYAFHPYFSTSHIPRHTHSTNRALVRLILSVILTAILSAKALAMAEAQSAAAVMAA